MAPLELVAVVMTLVASFLTMRLLRNEPMRSATKSGTDHIAVPSWMPLAS